MLFRSPAKVNLYLRIGPLRADGFHPLVSWFCSVGLLDDLEFTLTAADELTMTSDVAGVPCDERNLVIRAARALMPYRKVASGLMIHLSKRIPMGGGLGGGSSNAATALRAINQLWDCGRSDAVLDALGATLGSDVPFFLHQPSAICRGRGERITSISAPRARAIVLILPPIEMPTPQVYRRFDELGLGTDLEAIERNLPDPAIAPRELLEVLVNDLEAPAFDLSPALADLRCACERLVGQPVRMSGSGSTLFTLYEGLDEAAEVASRIERELKVRAVPTTLGA